MNNYDNSIPFINYKVLESFLIEGEEHTIDELFSKMKEKCEAKKTEQEIEKEDFDYKGVLDAPENNYNSTTIRIDQNKDE